MSKTTEQRAAYSATPTHTEMLAMVRAMNKYGGSFVCGLADCFLRADSDNLRRLYKAFPEYVAQYLLMAERDARESTDATISRVKP